MKQIAIFASGSGSNTKKLIEYFAKNNKIKISLIVSNNPNAGVLKIAVENKIPTTIISNLDLKAEEKIKSILSTHNIDWIVLAGFLLQIPSYLVKFFPNKIINLHPALLPKFGGKGMYGHHVHEAVLKAKELQSGITIHFVDELYDHGKTISQITCEVETKDTVETLAAKIHVLEHQFFPRIVEQVILKSE